jgi:hypothetical protein
MARALSNVWCAARHRSTQWIAFIAVCGLVAAAANAEPKVESIEVSRGDRVGLLVLIDERATFQYTGRTIFGNKPAAPYTMTWDLPAALQTKTIESLRNRGIEPVVIVPSDSLRAMRGRFHKTGLFSTSLKPDVENALKSVVTDNSLKALLVLHTDGRVQIRRMASDDYEDTPMEIDNFGVYVRNYGFNTIHAFAYLNLNALWIQGAPFRVVLDASNYENAVRIKKATFPPKLDEATPELFDVARPLFELMVDTFGTSWGNAVIHISEQPH